MAHNTIRQAIESKITAQAETRVSKLIALKVPEMVIDRARAEVKKGAGTVGHIKDFGNLVFVEVENKTYRRGPGAEFTVEDGSKVWLIPGPYGLFLTNVEK